MKNFFLLLACALLTSLFSKGQSNMCYTDQSAPDILANLSPSLVGNPGPYLVRVAVWILRDDGGSTSVTQSEVDNALSILAQDMETQNICISLFYQGYVDNTNIYNEDQIVYIALSWFYNNNYYVQNAVNIYILPNETAT